MKVAMSVVSKESANMPKSFWGTQTAKQVLAIASFPLPQRDKIFNGMWPIAPPMPHQSIISTLLHTSQLCFTPTIFPTPHSSTHTLT